MQFYILLIPSVLIFYIVLFNICRHKFLIHNTFVAILITYIVTLFICMIPNPHFEVLVNFATIGCMAALVYQGIRRVLLSIFYAILTSITCMVGGNITGTILTNFFDMSIEKNRDSLFWYFTGSVISLSISLTISKFAGLQIQKSLARLSDEQKDKFALHGISLSVSALLLSYINVFIYRTVSDWALIEAINTILITTYFFFTLIIISLFSISQQKQAEAEYKQKAQEELIHYTRQLENNYSDMRSFYHDHTNLLLSFYGYTKSGDMEKLDEYINKNIASANDIMKSLDTSMDSLKFIHIPELKGILASKCAYAQMRKIDVRIDIPEPIENISINSVDLCRMVGIIFDNAIEELELIKHEHVSLKFGIVKNESEILIICSNTCKTEPQVEMIFDKGYSTKGKGRGAGLYNLKRICERYENLLVTTNTGNGEFTIIIIIMQR